jgi:hypothetical protein
MVNPPVGGTAGGGIPTMVTPPADGVAGGGIPTMVTPPAGGVAGGGIPAMVTPPAGGVSSSRRTGKTCWQEGQRTRNPAAGIREGSTS